MTTKQLLQKSKKALDYFKKKIANDTDVDMFNDLVDLYNSHENLSYQKNNTKQVESLIYGIFNLCYDNGIDFKDAVKKLNDVKKYPLHERQELKSKLTLQKLKHRYQELDVTLTEAQKNKQLTIPQIEHLLGEDIRESFDVDFDEIIKDFTNG